MPVDPLDSRINSLDVIKDIEEWDSDIENGTLEPDDMYEALVELNERGEISFSDWHYGVTLIAESEFVDYARELHEETSLIALEMRDIWPFNCIDWEQAADELRADYTVIEFVGETFLGRD